MSMQMTWEICESAYSQASDVDGGMKGRAVGNAVVSSVYRLRHQPACVKLRLFLAKGKSLNLSESQPAFWVKSTTHHCGSWEDEVSLYV